MKTDFDKELEKVMTEEKEIPTNVRKKLDSTYGMIEAQSKKKKNRFIWKRVAAAACALFLTGAVLTNEQVRASINDFFSFGDKGIERVVVEGFSQDSNSTATDQNINITLKQNFSDANKIGMSFQLEFDDPAMIEILKNGVTEISMDYRVKNGDDEYIVDFIPDTKELKGNGGYINGLTHQNPFIDVETGIVEYEVILDSNKGNLPSLQDAVVEIESINIFPEYDYHALYEEFGGPFDLPLVKIDGTWDLSLANHDESKPAPGFEYVAKDTKSDIQVISAIASPTSLNVKLIVDEEPFGSEGQFMKVIDEEGNEYETNGYNMETKNDKTTVGVNFQISSYNNAEKLRLIIENVGEVELLKE